MMTKIILILSVLLSALLLTSCSLNWVRNYTQDLRLKQKKEHPRKADGQVDVYITASEKKNRRRYGDQ